MSRVPALDNIARKGIFTEFYDPDGSRYGLPTYPYQWAPTGLLTMRQLPANGLRPGGQAIAAQIIWQHRGKRRVAYLYRADRQAQARSHAGATSRHRLGAARPPHLPHMRHREGLLHTAAHRRM